VFVLIISFILSSDERVVQLRKRLKETSFKAKTLRVPFKDKVIKKLNILIIVNVYNYYMRAIDEFDHLITQNLKLRSIKRGGSQVLEH
jgi:hypothetical protein